MKKYTQQNVRFARDIRTASVVSVSNTFSQNTSSVGASLVGISLQTLPNQNLTTTLNNNNYAIQLKNCGGSMVVTIIRNGVTLVQNLICVAGTPLIPYQYLEDGNFLFLTNDSELPDYTQFGITQFLIYASPSELEALRAARN